MGGGARTEDGGKTWHKLSKHAFCEACTLWEAVLLDDSTLWGVGSKNSNYDGLVYKSTDNGKSWSMVWDAFTNATADTPKLYGAFGIALLHS